jgi:DNA mismatch repair protein MutS
MEIDQTTLNDLCIFNWQDEFSLFNKLNFTRTVNGREQLRQNLSTPLDNVAAINGVQQTLQCILQKEQHWPMRISNGTLMVIERFYDTVIDDIPASNSAFSAFMYRFFHNADFSLVKYSVAHCFDFIKGMQQLVEHFLTADAPGPIKQLLEEVKKSLDKKEFDIVRQHNKATELPIGQQLYLAHYLRYHFKNITFYLMQQYARLDAWYGMAKAVQKFNLVFPAFSNTAQPELTVNGLYHLLLDKPVPCNVEMNSASNFIFLTGANMAGKSTFIKAVGTAVFMAHTGMGVAATKMQLSYFDGILSNINVMDNIVKGESYFYNEVQRIKATINKINNGRKWLILIDELFKGTNIQDAMKCSSTVIEGLLKISNSLFILSTHLYEIGEDLKKYPNINFRYFETTVAGEQLRFNYQLKSGISNDRLGYLILKREGVVQLLESL